MNPMNKAWSLLKQEDRPTGSNWNPRQYKIPYDLGASKTNRGRKWKPQVPVVGGNEADIRQGLSGDAPISEDTSAMDALASGTRQDLINMLLAKVQEMSDVDILNLLQMTEGGLIDTLGEPNMPPPSTMEPFRPEIRDVR